MNADIRTWERCNIYPRVLGNNPPKPLEFFRTFSARRFYWTFLGLAAQDLDELSRVAEIFQRPKCFGGKRFASRSAPSFTRHDASHLRPSAVVLFSPMTAGTAP
jgi:hypothetical protein